jgi:hypothetical protein
VPVETIKCQECGSADVTEFKSSTYVCGHCEAIFKHIEPSQGTNVACSCGTFAVGRCAECDKPVCADCSKRVNGVRLCVTCAQSQQYEASTRRLNAAAQRRVDTRQALRLIEDPYERLCVALKELTHKRPAGAFENNGRSGLPGDLLAEICPELWETPPVISDLENDPPWDGADIARWFAGRAEKSNIQPKESYEPGTVSRTLFGGRTRDAALPCWRFVSGSTHVDAGENPRRADAFVLVDGRLVQGSGPRGRENLTGTALIAMARMLEQARPREH